MTNNKQQTAVEWFSVRRDVLEIEVRLGKLSPIEYAEELTKAEQQAKEMEKQRMIDFANNCIKQIEVSDTCELLMVESPKDLYEQTYGGGDK